jgi:uncharacterized membrane protein
MVVPQPAASPPRSLGRIVAIDIARGAALVAMASYHFTWDLEFFGYADPGLTAFGPWKTYARCIATTFLFLVGVSLVLAHGKQIRWNGFWKRLAMVTAAALGITAVTFVAVPGGFIFFGILHQIALASVLGLAFLRLPWLLTALLAALVVAAPSYLRSPVFDNPALWWVGLSSVSPRSNDYVPLFPWFGAVLAGIAVTRMAAATGVLAWIAALSPGRWARPLVFIGRHSLAFYLIHQPVLIACIWAFSQIAPAPVEPPQTGFLKACQASCKESRDTAFCSHYCACMLDAIEGEGALDRIFKADQSPQLKARIGELAGMCTAEADNAPIGGETP